LRTVRKFSGTLISGSNTILPIATESRELIVLVFRLQSSFQSGFLGAVEELCLTDHEDRGLSKAFENREIAFVESEAIVRENLH